MSEELRAAAERVLGYGTTAGGVGNPYRGTKHCCNGDMVEVADALLDLLPPADDGAATMDEAAEILRDADATVSNCNGVVVVDFTLVGPTRWQLRRLAVLEVAPDNLPKREGAK